MGERGPSNVLRLAKKLGLCWENLRRAQTESHAKLSEIELGLLGIDSEDTSIVVSGSLARDEFTAGSDIDWTLLIDGLADPEHHVLVRRIRKLLQPLAKPLGREGTFGEMVFSHDLIHQIGGEDDTNRNTRRRLLLLLESRAVGRSDAYIRVVRHILVGIFLRTEGSGEALVLVFRAFCRTISLATGALWLISHISLGAVPAKDGLFEI